MRCPTVLLAILLLAGSPALLLSQEGTFSLRPGERIRIASPIPGAGMVRATVTHWEPDWIAFSLRDGQVWTRHMYDVEEVQVLREVPTGRRARRSAAWGFFLGTSAGIIAAPFVAYGLDSDVEDWTAVATGAGVGAVSGLAVGTLVGVLFPRRGWTSYVFGGEGR